MLRRKPFLQREECRLGGLLIGSLSVNAYADAGVTNDVFIV